jgi:hypothetical protein
MTCEASQDAQDARDAKKAPGTQRRRPGRKEGALFGGAFFAEILRASNVAKL